MLRVAQPSVVLGEAARPVLYCFSMRSDAMALPRTPRPACRFSSEYSANVPPAPQLCCQVSRGAMFCSGLPMCLACVHLLGCIKLEEKVSISLRCSTMQWQASEEQLSGYWLLGTSPTPAGVVTTAHPAHCRLHAAR